jgi:hypothetical protein
MWAFSSGFLRMANADWQGKSTYPFWGTKNAESKKSKDATIKTQPISFFISF